MPKKTRDFPANLNFNVALEIRQGIVSLSYLRGNKGSIANVARDALQDGLRLSKERLDDRQRRDFEEILKNIQERDKVLENKKPPP